MANYITIDGGTTNTRIRLVCGGNVTDEILLSVGAGKGSVELKKAIKKGLCGLRQKAKQRFDASECIIGSGMLTSELGICPLEHIKTPVGIAELNKTMARTEIPELSTKPFYFIRGVKTDDKCPENADMMRGEETELVGLAERPIKNCIYILPGSHSKIIETDSDGRIVDFSTMLTGEMIKSLAENTILVNSFNLGSAELCENYLIKGFDYCDENGINKALFKVRVLRNVAHISEDEAYSFFMGVVLCGEVTEIIKKLTGRIVIGGQKQIKQAMIALLKAKCNCDIIAIDDSDAKNASSVGMVRIFEYSED